MVIDIVFLSSPPNKTKQVAINKTAKGAKSKYIKTHSLKHSKGGTFQGESEQEGKSMNIVPVFKNCLFS